MHFAYLAAWGLFLLLVLAMLAIDLFVLHRKAHEIRFKEALLGTFIPISLALLFMVFVYYAYEFHWFELGLQENVAADELAFWPTNGAEAAILYITGYLVELSLSADNVFLFVVLMGFFAVPNALQHRVLFWGVLGALVMRALLIGSVSFLVKFKIVIFLFGLFLIFTGIKMLFSKEEEEGDPSQTLVIRMAKKFLPIYPHYEGGKFFVRPADHGGKLMATNLFLVLVSIEFTDLVFALDSIPAIFGITKDPFIVFTSNVFAILGLRSMYFLLAGVMDKFHLLKYGLSVVLAFVGVKMILPTLGHYCGQWISQQEHHWHVNNYLSLGVIAGVLTITIIASLVFPQKHEHAEK